MITGQLKNKIDSIWDTFFAAGITTPLTVVEQITYLLFIKLLDDNQIKKEATASIFKTAVKNPVFKDGNVYTNLLRLWISESIARRNLKLCGLKPEDLLTLMKFMWIFPADSTIPKWRFLTR